MTQKIKTGWPVCFLLLALFGVPAAAQDDTSSGLLGAKYFASVGMFASDRKVRLGLDASIDISVPQPKSGVDFSEQFSVQGRDDTFSAELGWNFGERWQFRGQYFRVEDGQQVSLEQDVQWGDYIFNAGTSASGGTDIQITRLFFGRKFWDSKKHVAGVGLGAHFLDLSAFVSGNATINGEDVGFVYERASISQPLPNIGGWIDYAPAERWMIRARLDWLAASVDDYDGHIINASFGVSYDFSDHFGIGLAYNRFEIELGIDDSSWQGQIRSRFAGPYLALTAFW